MLDELVEHWTPKVGRTNRKRHNSTLHYASNLEFPSDLVRSFLQFAPGDATFSPISRNHDEVDLVGTLTRNLGQPLPVGSATDRFGCHHRPL